MKTNTLGHACEACTKARAAALSDMRSHIDRKDRAWTRSRNPQLLAIDIHSNRLEDGNYVEWKRRMSDVIKLSQIPGAVKVVVSSGIDYAPTKADLENFNYDTENWEAVVWRKPIEVGDHFWHDNRRWVVRACRKDDGAILAEDPDGWPKQFDADQLPDLQLMAPK